MRDRTRWRARLHTEISRVWQPGDGEIDVGTLLDVELGLHLWTRLRSAEPAEGLRALLSGYPLLDAMGAPPSRAERDCLSVARHLLAPLRTRRDWTAALRRYTAAPENVRAFVLDDNGVAVSRPPSVAADREAVFDEALSHSPRLRREPVKVAGPGRYLVRVGGRMTSVEVPDSLPLARLPAGHDTAPRIDRAPVIFTWAELRAVAQWMDDQEVAAGLPSGDWTARFARVRLDVRDEQASGFTRAGQLVVDGSYHLIGMVSSGKTTLMVLLAVCAARRGERVTLVVGDVIAALRHVSVLRQVGVLAAPIVGASTQRRHIDRLLRLHTTKPHTGSALTGFEDALDLLSTACALDALRPTARPWEFREAPCRRSLLQSVSDEPGDSRYRELGCPLWGGCQRHHSARGLVDAMVWVATSASLVYSRVPQELNPELLRYLELAWRRSDLIIVDEADQVQAQLDAAFSPGQTLIGQSGDPWLQLLMDHTEAQLRGRGWVQFTNRHVREWSSLVDTARSTSNRLYALLQRHPLPRGSSTMRRWIGRDCFTEWTLADKLVSSWSGPDSSPEHEDRRSVLRAAFDTFLLDPLGVRARTAADELAAQLIALTRELGNLADEGQRAQRLADWLHDVRTKHELVLDTAEVDEHALRLEFTLLLAVLSNTLNALIRGWRGVDAELSLDAASGMIFQRPPDDFTPVVPSPPMGSILGYQYREEPDQAGAMGQLRFFRCTGIGRWVLLRLHELFRPDSARGPAVLLMSGTSWAGSSPRYDVQISVNGILRAPVSEIDAIRRSTFDLTTVNDRQGQPVSVSGLRGAKRTAALRTIVQTLTRRIRPDRPSPLERERDLLDPDRRRVLLVVGSYAEARHVAEDILDCRSDWEGQVLHLVADESDFTTHWSPTLRRGEITRFAGTGAWILVAPLLAIERGHNILADTGRAAIGSAYFLVRPHPRPDDISYPVQAMNRWAVEQINAMVAGHTNYDTSSLEELDRQFRSAAYRRWQHSLTVPLVYSSVGDDERDALAWTQLVTIWQVVGRLVRGGCAARVHFCDAKFAPHTALRADHQDDASDSLLVGMHAVLDRYLAPHANPDPLDRELADALYGPLYTALKTIPGVTHAVL